MQHPDRPMRAAAVIIALLASLAPGIVPESKTNRVAVLELYMSGDREETWAELTFNQAIIEDECSALGYMMYYAREWCTIEQMQSDINWHWKLQRDSLPIKRKF